MDNQYSVRINRQEGTVEITGNDKEWVSARLNELKDIIVQVSQTAKPKTNETQATNMLTPKTAPRKRTTGSGSRSQKNEELLALLTRDMKTKLEAYVSERQINFDRSLPAQAAIIATFLQDNLNMDSVDHNDMYTVYTVMGWKTPGNLRSQLVNAQTRNQYFGGVTDGKYPLSHKGENYARHDSAEES